MGEMNSLHTERLYYEDAYLRQFTARVVAVREIEGRAAVALDRTAFYPTGGGQPHDTGTLDGIAVVDVVADDGMVWHVLESAQGGPDAGAEVEGAVNWERRFDHMQQHTGQHVLSEAFIRACGAHTVAFHLGTTASTIDLDRAGLDATALAAAEEQANAVVDDASPVTAAFLAEAEATRLPLRKAPAVRETVRVVEVAGFDWSACGGTHVANTAQIGLIKIVGTERRGPELRVSFLCGRRARADYARLQRLAEGLAARFSVGQDEVPAAVERLAEEARGARKELSGLEAEWATATAARLWSEAPEEAGRRVVALAVAWPLERAKRLAQTLRAYPGTVVLFGLRAERPQLIFTRADDLEDIDAGRLLRVAAEAAGGRGGGRPDWAQGGVPSAEGLETALAAARRSLQGL